MNLRHLCKHPLECSRCNHRMPEFKIFLAQVGQSGNMDMYDDDDDDVLVVVGCCFFWRNNSRVKNGSKGFATTMSTSRYKTCENDNGKSSYNEDDCCSSLTYSSNNVLKRL